MECVVDWLFGLLVAVWLFPHLPSLHGSGTVTPIFLQDGGVRAWHQFRSRRRSCFRSCCLPKILWHLHEKEKPDEPHWDRHWLDTAWVHVQFQTLIAPTRANPQHPSLNSKWLITTSEEFSHSKKALFQLFPHIQSHQQSSTPKNNPVSTQAGSTVALIRSTTPHHTRHTENDVHWQWVNRAHLCWFSAGPAYRGQFQHPSHLQIRCIFIRNEEWRWYHHPHMSSALEEGKCYKRRSENCLI